MDSGWVQHVRRSRPFIPVLIAAWLIFLTVGGSVPVQASLNPPDATNLEACLNHIASGDSSSGDLTTCKDILAQPNPASDWTEFFQDYFADHPFSNNLWGFLVGPVFYGQGNQAVLQAGLTPVLEELITRIVAAHPADLGPFLAANPDTRDTLLNAHHMFVYMAHYGKIGDSDRQAIFAYYVNHINAFPQYWKKSATIDLVAQPYVAGFAAQIHAILRDLLPLTASTKNAIAQALDLQGRYRDIWMDFSVLLYDNNGFDTPQREFLYRFFALNPKELVVVTSISQNELIGNSGATQLPYILSGVNVFGTRVGQVAENPFPPDGAAFPCDAFGEVVAHEDYHAVDANYVYKNQELQDRRYRLIIQAGRDPANYLRGGSPGFFADNPQEFLASLANQWFCSSADMLHLGIDRFLRGNPHGIDQALYFAELISVGSNSTWLYTNDLQGNMTRQAAAITRNADGFIDSIAMPEATYHFEVNQDGLVTRLWEDGARLELDPAAGLTHFYKPGESGDLQFTLRNTGSVPLRTSLEPVLGGLAFKRGALQLEGRSGVSVPNSASLNMTAKITLEAWIFPLTWENPPFSNCRILQKGFSDNQYRLLEEGHTMVFDVANVRALRLSNKLPPLNTWTHVAGVYDGKMLRMYFNGELVGEQAAAGSIGTTSDPLIIGDKDIGGSDGFIGYIDTVRVWSVGRTQAQIQAGMSGSASGQSGLVGDWRFNDPGSGPVADASPSQNTGSLDGLARISWPDGPNGLTARLSWWSGVLPPGQSQAVTVHIETSSIPEGSYPIHYQLHTSGASDAVDYILSLQISKTTPTPKPTPVPTPTQKPFPQNPPRIFLPEVVH